MKKIIILLVISLLSSCQSTFIFFPEKEVRYTPKNVELHYEQVEFKTVDNIILSGWWIPSVRKPVILYCHGNGGNVSHLLDIIKMYNKLGYNILVFDYRGYGMNKGSPSEQGTYLDAEAAWNYVVNTRKIPPKNIIIHGRSLGGSIAAWLAMKREPRMLIVESSFTSMKDAAKHNCSCTPALIILTYKYNTAEYLKKVKCPVLIIHSRDDELIPFHQGVRLFELANEPKEFCEISGSHNAGYYKSKNIYENNLKKFISGYYTN
ncbi:MAG: alpha/beta hydrolase [Spirochaetota bacterium]